ncbi:putative ornithine carbamoyltransferase [Trypoxylus dichotomus]
MSRNFFELNEVGRLITNPQNLTAEELESLLWTAIDIRTKLYRKDFRTRLPNIKDARVLILLIKPSPYIQLPAVNAAEVLETRFKVLVDQNWDTAGDIGDTMKFLESQADIIVGQCRFQCILDTIKKLMTPIFICKSLKFKSINCLAEIMTTYLKYGRLKGLKVAWLGQPNRLLNSYLTMGTKLGMNISYCCACNSNYMQSPAVLNEAKKICKDTHSILEECDSIANVLKDARVVITSKKGFLHETLTIEMMKMAAPDATTFFHLPRGEKQVADSLVHNEVCLTWEAAQNVKWIFAAAMVMLLSDYRHSIAKPKF